MGLAMIEHKSMGPDHGIPTVKKRNSNEDPTNNIPGNLKKLRTTSGGKEGHYLHRQRASYTVTKTLPLGLNHRAQPKIWRILRLLLA